MLRFGFLNFIMRMIHFVIFATLGSVCSVVAWEHSTHDEPKPYSENFYVAIGICIVSFLTLIELMNKPEVNKKPDKLEWK